MDNLDLKSITLEKIIQEKIKTKKQAKEQKERIVNRFNSLINPLKKKEESVSLFKYIGTAMKVYDVSKTCFKLVQRLRTRAQEKE